MGLFNRGPKAPKKPKRYYGVNSGPMKIQVHDTNDTQHLLAQEYDAIAQGSSGIPIAFCARTAEQIEAGHPDNRCVNVCKNRSKMMTPKNYFGYIDVDQAGVGYIKDLCDEYQIVEGHAMMTEKDGRYRLFVVTQRPNKKKSGKKK